MLYKNNEPFIQFSIHRKEAAPSDTLTTHSYGLVLTFGSVNAGGWFDRLLLTEKTFGLQSCEAVNCCVFLHSVAPTERGAKTAIGSSISVSQAQTQPCTSPESKQ